MAGAEQGIAQLDNYLKAASPERYRLLKEAGLLAGHLQAAWESTEGLSSSSAIKSDLSQLLNQAKIKALEIDSQIFEIIRINDFFSEDARKWPQQLHKYLRERSPESYSKAQEAGWIEDHVKFMTNRALRAFRTQVKDGVDPRLALTKATSFFQQEALSIQEPPTKAIANARQNKVISYRQFSEFRERYSYLEEVEKECFLTELLPLFVERPEAGSLLETTAFANIFANDDFYLLCLGACYFGQGKIAKSGECFFEVLSFNDTPLIYLLYANCWRVQNELEKGLEVLQSGIKKYPESDALISTSAGTAFSLGHPDLANQIFRPIKERYFAHLPRQDYVEKRRLELEIAIKNRHIYRNESIHNFDEISGRATWWNYWHHFNAYNEFQHPEGVIANQLPKVLSNFCAGVAIKPRALIEMDTVCGDMLFRLAQSHPEIKVVGVTSHPCIKKLNDEAYSLGNLVFASDDVFNVLDEQRPNITDGMFLQVHSGPYLYPAYLHRLYRECWRQGIRYIAIFETYCISYEQQQYQIFADMNTIAEITSSGNIHHNYPRLLNEAGYRLIHQEMLPPTLLMAGMSNTVFLVAERT